MQKGLVSEEVNGAQAQRLAALDAWIAKAGMDDCTEPNRFTQP
jgi:hypothetical protein